ncbi:MAG: hypothetical protein ACI4EG_12460 [Fusicatenibacter sp.]|nr:hypothetical protein [Fusicatenibacter sp.]
MKEAEETRTADERKKSEKRWMDLQIRAIAGELEREGLIRPEEKIVLLAFLKEDEI